MEKYLTAKSRPEKYVPIVENAAAVTLFLVMAYFVTVAVQGYRAQGLSTQHIFLALIMAALAVPLHFIFERMRARKHAELILRALVAREEGCIPLEEADEVIRVFYSAKLVGDLTEKGYMQGVTVRSGFIWLADRMPEQAEEKEIKPIFRN